MSMTHEEAARILDPETSREALDEIEYYGGFRGDEAVLEAVNDACRIAAEVLRCQPAHIDREAWKCQLCERSKVISFKAWEDEEAYHEGGPFVQGGAIFCPHCGRPRTPEAWAELEKRMGVRG